MITTASWLSLFSNPIKLKTVERRNYIEIMQSKIKLVFVFCFIFKGLRVRIPLRRGVLDTTLCDKVCHWFSPGTPVSSANKTECHDITEIWLIVALNTINLHLVSK
jgi:hypothetical protein